MNRLVKHAAFLALFSFMLLSACNRTKTTVENGGTDSKDKPVAPENAVSDSFVVAHVKVGDVWNGPLFKEIFEQTATIVEGKDFLRDVERKSREEIGFWPADFDTLTFCMPELKERSPAPMFVLVATSLNPIDRDRFMKRERSNESRKQGFISLRKGLLLHFPDERTAAVMNESLADRYLAGYAKDKNGWPMSEGLKKAAEGHSLAVMVNVDKLPAELRDERSIAPLEVMLKSKSITLVSDLQGKEIRMALRGTFPDAATAKQAQDQLSKLVKGLAGQVGKVLDDPREKGNMGAAYIAVKEAQRALAEMKIATSGSDLTINADYKADFSVSEMMADAVKKIQLAATRVKSQNNLKQIVLSFHNYASTYNNKLIISGIDAKGVPISDLKAKPLLSWRVAILPFIEQQNLYQQFKLNEPWDSPHNKKLIDKMPKIYAPENNVKAPEGQTFYQMVIGPTVMRPGFTLAAIPDGSSQTISVVEAAEPVIWTKPDDVFIPGKEMPKDLKKKFGGLFKNGCNVAMWDGSIRWIELRTISETTLWNALRPDDGHPLGPDW